MQFDYKPWYYTNVKGMFCLFSVANTQFHGTESQIVLYTTFFPPLIPADLYSYNL